MISKTQDILRKLVQFGLVGGTLLLGVSSASAQWVVFDPTNYMQTAISAMEAVNGTAQRAQSYMNQLQQYKTMLTQLKQLPDGSYLQGLNTLSRNANQLFDLKIDLKNVNNAAAAATELSRVSGDLNGARNSLSAIVNLSKSMGGMQESFSRRFEDAQRMNLTWDQYAAQEDMLIRSRVITAASRAQEDQARIERVKSDYDYAQDMAARIPQAEGVQQSMGIMNSQMNRVVGQLAELNKGLASNLAGKNPNEVLAEEMDKQKKLDNKRVAIENLKRRRQVDAEVLDKWTVQ